MKNLSPEQYQAVKEFAQGLKECFIHYKNNHHDKFSDIVLEYAINIINIHLDLAELGVEKYLMDVKNSLDK